MSEQRWEYCELWLDDLEYHKAGLMGGKEGWSCDCGVRYYTVAGAKTIILASKKTKYSFRPFEKAMALLGLYGWELVSLQLGSPGIQWDRKVAHLKRPVISGRTVYEPELVIDK